MLKFLAPTTVVAALALSGSAWAAPSFCTGTITTVQSGGFVSGSDLLNGTASNGNCVEASDKIFGNFSVSGAISGAGGAGFLFTMQGGPADVSMGFTGLVGSSTTGTINYQVAVDPALSNGALITELEKDLTFNSLGAGSTVTLTGTVTPNPVSFSGGSSTTSFDCVRGSGPQTCPQFGFFSPPQTMLTVDQTITTGPNTNVTGITDTVFQAVPEPTALAMLGSALVMLGTMIGWRRRQS